MRGKIIYSGGMDVDILPEGASKGEGLKFLLRQVGSHIPLSGGGLLRQGQRHHGHDAWQRMRCSEEPNFDRLAVTTNPQCCIVQIKEAGNAPKDGVMVCGDSGNDVELFAVPGVRGCMVVNAHQELKQWCDAHASPDLFQASTAPACRPLFRLTRHCSSCICSCWPMHAIL